MSSKRKAAEATGAPGKQRKAVEEAEDGGDDLLGVLGDAAQDFTRNHIHFHRVSSSLERT